MLLDAHRPTPGTCVFRSVSAACVIERCFPLPAPFPPRPPQLVALPCSAGSQVLRHSPASPARACPPFGSWPSRTGLDPQARRTGDLPVLVHVVSQRARVLRLRRTGQPLAFNAAAVLPFSISEGSRHPDPSAFRSSIARPTGTSGLRFRGQLTLSPARLEARMASLFSFPVGLLHPLQHAGLSRRTPSGRQSIQKRVPIRSW